MRIVETAIEAPQRLTERRKHRMKGGSVDEAVQRIKDMVERSAEKRLKG